MLRAKHRPHMSVCCRDCCGMNMADMVQSARLGAPQLRINHRCAQENICPTAATNTCHRLMKRCVSKRPHPVHLVCTHASLEPAGAGCRTSRLSAWAFACSELWTANLRRTESFSYGRQRDLRLSPARPCRALRTVCESSCHPAYPGRSILASSQPCSSAERRICPAILSAERLFVH